MNLNINKFPSQGSSLGKRVKVYFNGNFSKSVGGTIVRDDIEYPCITIIRLNGGNYVTGQEVEFEIIK